VTGVPGVPSAEESSALSAAELAVRLAEAYRLIAELTAQIERLSARVEDLERQARKDSLFREISRSSRAIFAACSASCAFSSAFDPK
jgi:hypothetical protein